MAKKELENKLIAAIRVRGRVNVRESISTTLERLNLKRVNNLSLIRGSKSSIGMLQKCNDYITYGEISKDVLRKVLEKSGMNIEEDSLENLFNGSKTPKELGIKMPIRMRPPKHGYESTKRSFTVGGSLGYRAEKINDLIKRMI
ncbi:MAG: uL30 family ribosomal protein [Candidatus Micrarchaeia archaeon]